MLACTRLALHKGKDMSEVKRFSVGVDGVDPNGNLVRYTDYAALEKRAEAAEAKLAELDKSEPAVWCNENDLRLMVNKRMIGGMMTVRHHGECPLFTRPAPAINLTELLPDVEENEQAFNAGVNALVDCLEDCGDSEQGLRLALRASRASILRNIEEQSQ